MTPEREKQMISIIDRLTESGYIWITGGEIMYNPERLAQILDDALKADNDTLTAEIDRLKEQIANDHLAAKDSSTNYRDEITTLKGEVERLEEELSNAKSDLLEAGGEIQDLEFRLDAAVKEIEANG